MSPITTNPLSYFIALWIWIFGEDSKDVILDEKTLYPLLKLIILKTIYFVQAK